MIYQKKPVCILLLIFCFCGNYGFAQTSTTAADEQSAVSTTPETPQEEKNLIHFGDLIDIDVVGSFEYDWRGTINPEGFLDGMDFFDEPIFALCRSEAEIAAAVVAGYSKTLREPKVVVKIIDRSNRALSVLQGAVKKSQRFQIKRAVNLNELLILAGGLTDRVSGEIQIFRPQNVSCNAAAATPNATAKETGGGGEQRERFVKTSRSESAQIINIRITDLLSGNAESNPQILSGDIVTVLEAEPIYVIGGVNTPKQLSLRSEITLSRAVASAGGLAKSAEAGSVTIFRRENGETKIIEADLSKIEAGESEDIVLKKLDIVEVGQKGRGKSKFPPAIQTLGSENANLNNFPLRVID